MMSVMTDQHPSPERGEDLRRRKRGRNLAVLFAIFAFCALFYVITIVRMV